VPDAGRRIRPAQPHRGLRHLYRAPGGPAGPAQIPRPRRTHRWRPHVPRRGPGRPLHLGAGLGALSGLGRGCRRLGPRRTLRRGAPPRRADVHRLGPGPRLLRGAADRFLPDGGRGV